MPCLYHRGNIRELFTSSHIIKAPMNRHLDTFLQRKLKIYDHQLASRGRRLMFVRKELNTRPAFEPPTVYSFLRKTASMPRPLWGWGCPLFAWQLSFSLIKIYCSSVTMGGGAGGVSNASFCVTYLLNVPLSGLHVFAPCNMLGSF